MDLSLAELYPLIAEGLSAGGTYRFYPKGKSMLPLLKEGADSVVLSSVNSLKVGDIVLYRRKDGTFVIHRIVKMSNTLSMCGDNQFVIEKGVLTEQVLAKVTAIYKKDTLLSLDSFNYRFYSFLLPLRRFKLKSILFAKKIFRKVFKSR